MVVCGWWSFWSGAARAKTRMCSAQSRFVCLVSQPHADCYQAGACSASLLLAVVGCWDDLKLR